MSETLSFRAYAKQRGVSHVAVGKAYKTGRLKQSVRVIDGRPSIIDPSLADREWADNSRTQKGGVAPTDATRVDLSPLSRITLAEAQRQLTIERTRKLQLERDVAEGRLVLKTAVVKETFEVERIIRENVLNIPARLAGELAAETDAVKVHMRLDVALREALNAVADQLVAGAHE